MGCAGNTNRHMTPDSRLSEQNYKKLRQLSEGILLCRQCEINKIEKNKKAEILVLDISDFIAGTRTLNLRIDSPI